MNVATVVFGAAMVAFGLATLAIGQLKPTAFRKLGEMRERFGHALGTAIHIFAYSLIPIGGGVNFIIQGLAGQPVF